MTRCTYRRVFSSLITSCIMLLLVAPANGYAAVKGFPKVAPDWNTPGLNYVVILVAAMMAIVIVIMFGLWVVCIALVGWRTFTGSDKSKALPGAGIIGVPLLVALIASGTVFFGKLVGFFQ
jgi:hypothetical protein